MVVMSVTVISVISIIKWKRLTYDLPHLAVHLPGISMRPSTMMALYYKKF